MVATAFSNDVAYVQTLGADRVIDVQKSRFEEVLTDVDVVLDIAAWTDDDGRARRERALLGIAPAVVRLRSLADPLPAMGEGLLPRVQESDQVTGNLDKSSVPDLMVRQFSDPSEKSVPFQ